MRYRGSPAPCKLRFTFAEDAAELETRQEKSPAIAAGRRTVKQSRSPAMMSPTAVSYGRRPRVFVTERFDRRRGELEQTRPQEAVQRTAFTLARQQQPAEDDERRRARNAAEARRAGEQERPHGGKTRLASRCPDLALLLRCPPLATKRRAVHAALRQAAGLCRRTQPRIRRGSFLHRRPAVVVPKFRPLACCTSGNEPWQKRRANQAGFFSDTPADLGKFVRR